MKKLPIMADSFVYIIILAILSYVLYIIFKPLCLIGIILLAFVLYFFRNPYRKVPEGDDIIVSPADGRVMYINEIYEPDFLNSKAIKISIFLSIFNVHVNRSPINGVVKYTHYRPGKFLPAYKTHASEINERNTIGIEGKALKVLVHQITGLIARRIVCWVKKDDTLELGERFGMIKFGSCTEIIVPANVEIKVKPGDIVRGAKTIIGVVK